MVQLIYYDIALEECYDFIYNYFMQIHQTAFFFFPLPLIHCCTYTI